MFRRTFTALCVTLLLPLAASARCRPLSTAEDVQASDFVVEAVLVHAGPTPRFRTTVVWKGGASAPARFRLGPRRGRGDPPWSDSSATGQTFLLFLRGGDDGTFQVARCGRSGRATDRLRNELRDAGLTGR